MTRRPARTATRTRSRTARGFDRIQFISVGFVVISICIGARLTQVQVVQHAQYQQLASSQHELADKITPKRGEIYAHDRYADTGLAVLSTNQSLYTVFVNPDQFQQVGSDPQAAADVIGPVLSMDPKTLVPIFTKVDDVYEPLKNRATEPEVAALQSIIDEKKLSGIDWVPEPERYYPEKDAAATLTGFLGYAADGAQRVGQYGLEEHFNDLLAGTPGSVNVTSTNGALSFTGSPITEAEHGSSLVLTIDRNIQYQACNLLSEKVKFYKAKQGSLIVMNPKTGAILAMCNAPTYDPNHYMDVEDLSVYINHAVSAQWEPGSVFKSFTMAAAINDKKITPQTTYTDTGSVTIAGATVRNALRKAYGTVDMTFVLENSLNTGSIFAVNQIGPQRWSEYVKAFGFGRPTGIELSNEPAGDIRSLDVETNRDLYAAQASFGQGVTVTPIQLIQAFGALANDGKLMKPYLVDRIVAPDGTQTVTQPEQVGQPVTAETARTVAAMMVKVIDGAHSASAGLAGYFIAGKTGTAQIPLPDGSGYSEVLHNDTFVGFFPVSDPQVVVLVKIDEPHTEWADESAAPIFGALSKFLVNYLQIPPDRPVE